MSRGTILTVDDNPDNLVLLTGILDRAGYRVLAANGGLRAIRIAEKEKPELILLDIDMPDLSGFEACRRLRERPETSHIPVIFVSALSDAVDKLKGFEAGGVDYVTKPYDEAEVLARVESQLRIHRLQRDLEERNRQLLAMNAQLVREQQKTEEVFSAFSELLPGRILDEAFQIGTKIGRGGFGIVYRGSDLRLKRPVAIKVLRPLGEDDGRLARFRTEGIAACRVRHPNAVEVHAAGYSQGVAFLVMELLSGESLGQLLDREPRLPLHRASSIAASIAAALTAAHAARVIHRDIKPDNVFLHREGSGEIVKVLDFGIARLVDAVPPELANITRAGDTIGTPEYMAPERLLGGAYDASADIYGLGVVLFRMLTGASLYAAQERFDAAEMVRLHLTDKPRAVTDLAPELPPRLAELLTRMIARDPAERPTSRETAEILTEFAT